MNARAWLQIGLVLLLVASGCVQRADWIEGTLVTVDVAGRWTGTMYGGWGGALNLTLRQTGPKVTGDVNLASPIGHVWSGPIEGTVSGDVLRFSRPDGNLRGEVIVAGDEMSGTVYLASFANFFGGPRALRLQRQSGGQPESR